MSLEYAGCAGLLSERLWGAISAILPPAQQDSLGVDDPISATPTLRTGPEELCRWPCAIPEDSVPKRRRTPVALHGAAGAELAWFLTAPLHFI